MPQPNPEATAFLRKRHSQSAKAMMLPVPSRDEVLDLLSIAARVPDHGKLEPWRFVVLERPAMARLADLAEACARAQGGDDERIAKGRGQFDRGLLAVVVVASPRPSGKVPEVEQLLSAGAVCLELLNAAEAAGWGANWLTGWPAHDRGFVEGGLGLTAQESVAGIIHIATPVSETPDRPRPDVARLTTWAAP
jgi:nitroreductase